MKSLHFASCTLLKVDIRHGLNQAGVLVANVSKCLSTLCWNSHKNANYDIMTAFNILLPIRESGEHFVFNDNNEDVVGKVFCYWQDVLSCVFNCCAQNTKQFVGQNQAIKRKIGHEVSIAITGRSLENVEKVVDERCVIDNIVAHGQQYNCVYFVILQPEHEMWW